MWRCFDYYSILRSMVSQAMSRSLWHFGRYQFEGEAVDFQVSVFEDDLGSPGRVLCTVKSYLAELKTSVTTGLLWFDRLA